jgi:protein arginine N-methyltransferase 1
MEDSDAALFKPKVLSEECLLIDLDLQTDDLDLAGELPEVRLRIKRPGTLGALAVYFRAYLDEDIQLTNAPFAPPTSWGLPLRPVSRRVQVAAGEEVGLRIKLLSRRGRQYLDVDLA